MLRSILRFLFPKHYKAIKQFYTSSIKKYTSDKTKWGFTIAGNKSMVNGSFEPIETELIRRLIPQVEVVINIGANIGYYCLHALSMGKKVIAIEPNESNVKLLLRNIQENGFSEKIEVFPVAISNKTNILNLFGGGTGSSLIKGWSGSNTNDSNLVPCTTLDRILNNKYLNSKILIIADVEGHEFELLQGSIETITKKIKPIWFLEISYNYHFPKEIKNNPNYDKIFKLFFENNYKAYSIGTTIDLFGDSELELIKNKIIIPKSYNYLFVDKNIEFFEEG